MKERVFTVMFFIALSALGVTVAGAAKVDVCHLPPGNPFNWHSISIGENALQAHLNHGDLEGGCVENCEALCDDGDACTQDVQNDPEECICRSAPRPPVDCDDANPCTADSCEPLDGCVYDSQILNGTQCDDGSATTQNDECSSGVCTGVSCPCQGMVGNDLVWDITADFDPTACEVGNTSTAIWLWESFPGSGDTLSLNSRGAGIEGNYVCGIWEDGGNRVRIDSMTAAQYDACYASITEIAADKGLTCPASSR